MPGKTAYRFLPLRQKKGNMGELPTKDSIEMSHRTGGGVEGPGGGVNYNNSSPSRPKQPRTPSMIADKVINESIYRYKYQEEEKKKAVRKRAIIIGIAAAVGIVIFVSIIIAVLATQLGKKTPEPIPPLEPFLKMWPSKNAEEYPDGIPRIIFSPSAKSTYNNFLMDLHNVLAPYRDKSKLVTGKDECTDEGSISRIRNGSASTARSTTHRCNYPTDHLGNECITLSKHYGYASGSPCILVALERTDEWNESLCENITQDSDTTANSSISSSDHTPGKNISSSSSSQSDLMVSDLQKNQQNSQEFVKKYVKVNCTGVDLEPGVELGQLEILPKEGFHLLYYHDPYYKQLPPLVMLQIMNVTRHKEVTVLCTLCSGEYKDNSPIYSVKFKLKID